MVLKKSALALIAFLAGVGTTLLVEKSLTSTQSNVKSGSASVERKVSKPLAAETGSLTSLFSAEEGSGGLVSNGEPDSTSRVESTASDTGCECVDMQDAELGGSEQGQSATADVVMLDPALEEARYDDGAEYAREEMRNFQESVMQKEAETNLYEPPALESNLTLEEQESIERDSMDESISRSDLDDALFRQVLQNEDRINEVYGSAESTEESEDRE